MEAQDVARAVDTLRAQGEPISARRVREVLGHGSYRDIMTHLRTLQGGEADADAQDLEPMASEEANITFSYPREDHEPIGGERCQAIQTPDPLAEAQADLLQAQDTLTRAEQAIPALEEALAGATRHLIEASIEVQGVEQAVTRWGLPRHDPLVGQTERRMQAASRAFREAQQAREAGDTRLKRCQQEVQTAEQRLAHVQREVYVQQHHPELWQALQEALEARAQDPLLQDPRIPFDAFQASVRKFDPAVVRSVAYHQQRIAALQAQVAQMMAAAGGEQVDMVTST